MGFADPWHDLDEPGAESEEEGWALPFQLLVALLIGLVIGVLYLVLR